jgi:hypothetical protein
MGNGEFDHVVPRDVKLGLTMDGQRGWRPPRSDSGLDAEPSPATGIRRAAPEIARHQVDVAGFLNLHRTINLMQEAALVLTWGQDMAGSVINDYWTECVNERAARALGAEVSELVHRSLRELLPADTALALHGLCDGALRATEGTECFAVAPDPMVDLSGTASIAVRATRVDDGVLCTWVPGWHVVGEDEDRRLTSATGTPVSDTLELAGALDTLADTGFGVFSVNLMTGRLIWSRGMYTIFDRTVEDGPVDLTDPHSSIEPISVVTDAWHVLVRDGTPLDVAVEQVASLGSRPLRISARATMGPDGCPAVVHGQCCVTAG